MKIWISDTQTQTHRIIRLNCEDHSDYRYIGDMNDDEFKSFLLELQDDIDLEKNMKLIKYYGYIHLLVKIKQLDS